MTFVEESHDPTTDIRSEKATGLAEKFLKKVDKVMADAVMRYKVECGRNNPSLAGRIGTQEHTLFELCRSLYEQTKYGGDEEDMGDTLMQSTREVMSDWDQEVSLSFLLSFRPSFIDGLFVISRLNFGSARLA
jgi:hypothetical protein